MFDPLYYGNCTVPMMRKFRHWSGEACVRRVPCPGMRREGQYHRGPAPKHCAAEVIRHG